MMIIRPVAAGDLQGLLTLAGKRVAVSLRCPPMKILLRRVSPVLRPPGKARCRVAIKATCSCLRIPAAGAVVGVCAIEVAVGVNDPWYNYRVGTLVHASKELNVYNALPTLFLTNDHTGSSELCTLFLDPAWRKDSNGHLLSSSRFLFMAAFRDHFNHKVVAEMRGVIDEHGYSPFWESLGQPLFLYGVFPRRLSVRYRAKSVYC
ncbi:Arginine N-succinyltransferase subunit beta [Kluyvera cryocrescens]|uniref:Arginine N-succinyltransferase subunit beta n=1 Tax=Kluyvera cryocrescens TaxID=580 RepID=A0A485AKF1_KLUCR|nr:Arginine N-succinyltransferase subunit beta [Kluyvera cryocrescens]